MTEQTLLSSTCDVYKYSYLVDNMGTLIFAVLTSIWGMSDVVGHEST
jgi:hypothetical protein